ncbi:MAG: hypothetical protein K2K09_05160 [Lachnospiraceae bacterium]|nr:hypothetical protein [Lachnospiraceae bacterium]
MKKHTPIPYDDTFRTMLNDCPRFIIPLVNEDFDKNYSPSDTVNLFQNEFFIPSNDDKKIVTDSNFFIGLDTDRYLFECQSTYDGTISIKIFEYSSQVAIRDAVSFISETIFTLYFSGIT